jgi:hypothetical protein
MDPVVAVSEALQTCLLSAKSRRQRASLARKLPIDRWLAPPAHHLLEPRVTGLVERSGKRAREASPSEDLSGH